METKYKITLYVASNVKHKYFAVCNKEGKPIWHDYYNQLHFIDTQLKNEISATIRALQLVIFYEYEVKKEKINEVEILTSEKKLLNFKNPRAMSFRLFELSKDFDFDLKINYITSQKNFAKKYAPPPPPYGYYNIDKIITEVIN